MAYKINPEYCIACGRCQLECKNGAVKEGDEVYVIDPKRCTECVGFFDSPQCVDNCFLSAIEPDSDYRESQEQLLAKFQKLHPRKTPQAA